jgi:hypothetical protein
MRGSLYVGLVLAVNALDNIIHHYSSKKLSEKPAF